GAAAQYAHRLQSRYAAFECFIDSLEVRVGVSRGQETRESLLNMDAARSHVIVEQRGERMLVVEIKVEPACKSLDPRCNVVARKHHVDTIHQSGRSCGEIFLKRRSTTFQMIQHGPCRRQQQWVPHECAGEERDSGFWNGVVSIVPVAAVQGVHKLGLSGEAPDR